MPRIPLWIFILISLVYFTAARVDIMDIDASQYAEISREMAESGSFLQIYDRGRDYLDKPPFLFWVSALSMKLFGANNFGYRFPSILFAIWALFATYRLARSLYDEHTGRLATLVLGCCQGMFLMTNDVRTDTILMSWTVTAIWLIREWEVSRKRRYFFAGCAAVAFGMMTKGPIALMVSVFCFMAHWAMTRQWNMFFRPLYIPGILLIGLLLVPMSIGLYQQYDLHPEKLVDGKTGVSGLRFFFWTQSFGRITGENVWDNNAPFSFLYENMLWAFLPWIILFTVALVVRISDLFRRKEPGKDRAEWISPGGFILAYLALGSSSYQLPHYIFIVFPLASIMVAALLRRFAGGEFRKLGSLMTGTQVVVSLLLLVVAMLTFTYIFRGAWWCWAIWGAGILSWGYLFRKERGVGRMVWLSAVAMIAANLIMTNHFYYTLLSRYQAGSNLGRYIARHDLPADSLRIYKMDDPVNILHFYAGRVVKKVDSFERLPLVPGMMVATGKSGLQEFRQHGIRFEVMHQGRLFKGSELTPEFINPATRREALKAFYLVRVK